MIYYIPRRYTAPKWQAKIIPLDKQFHFFDGPSVASLFELKQALNTVSEATLNHHVNSSKHDIADWVEFVVGDLHLATALRKQTHRWGLIVALERQLMRTLNLPPYVAIRWLTPSPNPLKFNSGEIIHSLPELAEVLKRVSDDTIDYHLQRHPNDIAQWIMLDIGDDQLAELVEEASNRTQMQQFVEDHLVMLQEASQD